MSLTCSAASVCSRENAPDHAVPLPEAPVQSLREIVRRFGTPAYAYDIAQVRQQVAKLRAHCPEAVEVLYSLKANPSLALCGVLAGCGFGADVASAGELATAREAGFSPRRILVSGPDKSPTVLDLLRSLPDALLSVDSVSELEQLAGAGLANPAFLRLRPDFDSFAVCSAASDSRFGLVAEDLPRCRPLLASGGVRVIGFHVFSGSQVLDAAGIIHHLRGAVQLSLRAADVLGVRPEVINLGGGFGIPYGPADRELDLAPIGAELRNLLERAAPARLMLELGRFLVAPAGWYLTTVLARQTHRGREAVVVDGGSHQRADLCGIGLRQKARPPVLLDVRDGPLVPTDVLGCLSLPGDVLAESKPLPALAPGDVLAFPNAGAYGLSASAHLFHCHPLPAEVAFEGEHIQLIRARPPLRSLLEGQSLFGASR
jgi:diaminopimelate decarboxylase